MMVEVEVFKEEQSFVTSKGMGSAAREWVESSQPTVSTVRSPESWYARPSAWVSMMRVRDDLLRLPQLH